MFVIVFLISQVAFGVYRLWSARDPNGIGYDNLTYPSILGGTAMKTEYRWDMDPHAYAHCQGVKLYDVASPYYMEYMKQKFIYLGIPYYSSLPVMTFFEVSAGEKVGHQPPIITDCKMGLTGVADKWETVKL